MDHTQQLRIEIEAAAKALGLAPSTVGERAGQGGKFYDRLCAGKRVWPETADAVRNRIQQMIGPSDNAPLPEADSVEGSRLSDQSVNAPAKFQGAGRP